MTPRKVTKFQTCERHEWLNRETRYRRAEFFAEGGPGSDNECKGGRCIIWPGRDIFCVEVCDRSFADWSLQSA
jgi:hypothetical protein